jgi:morphogenetic protein associated with SpoVID
MKYTVKRGDSLSKIARAYGLPTEQVIRANSQITNPNLIEVGDQINIPT